MDNEIIPDFNALCRLAEQKALSSDARKYIYFLWLGVFTSEMSSACYNPSAHTVSVGCETVFVGEDRIAECLSSDGGSPLGKKSISAAESELEKAGISARLIYKSGFFNMRYEQAVLKQPEDMVRIREMKRHIGISDDVLEKEYALYTNKRSAEK